MFPPAHDISWLDPFLHPYFYDSFLEDEPHLD
jgi:hypothetical protein